METKLCLPRIDISGSSAPNYLNCRDDGGHLVLIKEGKSHDRSDMTYQKR